MTAIGLKSSSKKFLFTETPEPVRSQASSRIQKPER